MDISQLPPLNGKKNNSTKRKSEHNASKFVSFQEQTKRSVPPSFEEFRAQNEKRKEGDKDLTNGKQRMVRSIKSANNLSIVGDAPDKRFSTPNNNLSSRQKRAQKAPKQTSETKDFNSFLKQKAAEPKKPKYKKNSDTAIGTNSPLPPL